MEKTPKIKSVIVKKPDRKLNTVWCTERKTRSARVVTVVKEQTPNTTDRTSSTSEPSKPIPRKRSNNIDLSDNQTIQPCEGELPLDSIQNLDTEESSESNMTDKRPGSPLLSDSKRQKPEDSGASTSHAQAVDNFDTATIMAMFSTVMNRMDAIEKAVHSKPKKTHDISDEEPEDPHSPDNISGMFDLGDQNAVEEGQIEENDDHEFSALLMKGVEDEARGKPLNNDALVIVKSFFDKAPEASVFKPLREQHNEPENCDNLSAKDVNPEVFRCMKEPDKTLDFMVKSVQSNVAASSVANLRMIDSITAMSRSNCIDRDAAKHLLDLCCDATKLSSRSYTDLSQLRKYLLRDLLAPKYRSLCFKKTFGNHLFGEDISKTVKAIDDETKIMKDFKKPFQPRRFESRIPTAQQPKNWEARGREPFRSQFRGYRRRGSRGRGVSQHQTNAKKPQQQN